MFVTAGVLGLFTSITMMYVQSRRVEWRSYSFYYSKLIQVQNISFDWIFFMYVVWNITICGVVVVSGYASHKTKMFAIVFLATVMVRANDYEPPLDSPSSGISLRVLPRVGDMDLLAARCFS